MPEAWVDTFWGWYLDGGGDSGFSETLSDQVKNYKPGKDYQDWDRDQLLIVHSDGPLDPIASVGV
jgi:hypothetical protein